MKTIIKLFLLLFFISCSNNQNNQIINIFLEANNIKLRNLSKEPYYLEKSLKHWKEAEFTNLNFNIKRNENYTIDTSMVKNKFSDTKSICKTKISHPLISNDTKKALIGVEEICGPNENITIYLLKKNEKGWVLETSINFISTFSH